MNQIRKRLTYANVMSSIAVFLVLGGATAFAAAQLGKNTVGSKQLKKNAVGAAKIKNNAVTTAKIKDGAVTASKLAAGAATPGAGSITTDKLANGAVTGEKLGAGSVGNDKLANGSVTGNKLAAGAVGRSNLAEGQLLPRGFARVEFDGSVDPALSVNIPDATRVGEAYCFDLPFPVLHAQATGEADGEGNDMASVVVAGPNSNLIECGPGTDVEVEMWDTGSDSEESEEFYLVVW